VNTGFQVGSAVVLALVTAVISAGSGGGQSAHAQLEGYRPALLLVTGVALAGLVVTLVGAVLDRRKSPVSVPDYEYAAVDMLSTK
jgi:hypothetical protein